MTEPTESRPEVKALDEKMAEIPVNTAAKEAEKPLEGISHVTLEQLTKAWKQIRALIKPQSPSLDGLLNSGRLLEVKNGVLVIGYATEILRSKVDTPEQNEITCKAILDVCGFNLSVKYVVTDAKQSTPRDVKADGMVAAALKKGGEIVDIQE